MTPLVLAVDYDGTIATGGRVAPETLRALHRWREDGRKVVLVTGRQLPDLRAVFPEIGLCDRVVAENGAVLHDPGSGAVRALGDPPEDELLAALRARGVDPLEVGRVIVATHEPHETVVGRVIAELGVAREIVRNKGAVMVLPCGVDKGSGMRAALDDLGVPLEQTVAVGDAENDLAMLAAARRSVAVANALDSVKKAGDEVTDGESGAGVIELIERLLGQSAARLWEKARERSDRAIAASALSPIETELEEIEDGGVPFVVRVISSLARKDKARGGDRNPFLPPEPHLVVTEVGDSHLVVLNKFNVVPIHLLLITRAFEDQAELLSHADFEALWACMAERDAFAFYNGGQTAGASQRHRHLQLVPVPLGRGPERLPIERALDRLPFPHALAETPTSAGRAREVYLDLLRAVDRERAGAAYNLLLTRDWMMAVPRTQERFDGISVNALGFAGSFLAKDHAQLETIRAAGPMRILREVT